MFTFIFSNQSARKLSQFAESAMAVKRVILQQFSMQLNYMNKERSNIYQPSARSQHSSMLKLEHHQQTKAQLRAKSTNVLDDDDEYDDDCSSSDDNKLDDVESIGSATSPPLSPTDDQKIQIILDNVVQHNNNNNNNTINAMIINSTKKCDQAPAPVTCKTVDGALQARRRHHSNQLYILCPVE